MNHYIQPQNDTARLAVLNRIHQKGIQDQQENIIYLTAETLTQIGSFIPQLTATLSSRQESEAIQRNARRTANTAVAVVAKHCRDIWSAAKRRIARDGLPVALYTYYGLSATGKNPRPQAQGEWLVTAAQLIQGEAAAVAAGYAPLAGPDVANLQTKVTAATTAVGQRDAAQTAYKAVLTILAEQREEADDLIAWAMKQLRYALRHKTDARRRDIMRGYGARFGERTEETPVIEEEAEMEILPAPAAMSLIQPYAAASVNGNGTAVRV